MIRKLTIVYLICIICFVFLTRLATIDYRAIINIDEAVSAVIADSIIDGGIPYKDAIDHRGPVTYYVYAVLFLLFGNNNMTAVHVCLAMFVAVISFLIYSIGRITFNNRTGLFASLFFSIFSWTNPPYDMWAFHTEWSLILFTTLGAYFFVKSQLANKHKFVLLSGICFGLSSLSKQIGLFDLASVFIIIIIIDLSVIKDVNRIIKKYLYLSLGFIIPFLITITYFYINEALWEFYFYIWEYNTDYYLAEITYSDRLSIAKKNILTFFNHKILFLISYLGGLIYCSYIIFSRQIKSRSIPNVYVLYFSIWSILSLLGSSLGGREFQHYFIQILPPFSLVAGIFLDNTVTKINDHFKRNNSRYTKVYIGNFIKYTFSIIFVLIIIIGLIHPIVLTLKKNKAYFLGTNKKESNLIRYLSNNSKGGDSIFVWGFDPEIYVFSNLKPASRYVYCNFLTGLVPWTKVRPYKKKNSTLINTDYAIVPGTWDILMTELEKNKPKFIIDTSPRGKWGYWNYPIYKFKTLDNYIKRYYVKDKGYKYNNDFKKEHIYIRK